jgi:hypothetical protein
MKEKNFKEWIKKAEKDLIAAKHLLSIKPNPPLISYVFTLNNVLKSI